MSSVIVLNRENILPNGFNNTLSLEFNNTCVNFKNKEVAVSSIQIYNSHFNIDNDYNNTSFQVQVPTAATYQTVNINLPNGYYSYTDISNYIATQLVAIGAYLIDDSNRNIVYISISENPTYYSAQVDLLATPTSLPSGWSRPASGLYSTTGTGLPTATNTTKLNILNNGFTDIIGFTSGTYPAATATINQSYLSSYPPTINPVSAYLVRCNLVNNVYSSSSDLLTSFTTQGTSVGELINIQPPELSWVNVADGVYSNITITITDQQFGYITFQDPGMLITLLIRDRAGART